MSAKTYEYKGLGNYVTSNGMLVAFDKDSLFTTEDLKVQAMLDAEIDNTYLFAAVPKGSTPLTADELIAAENAKLIAEKEAKIKQAQADLEATYAAIDGATALRDANLLALQEIADAKAAEEKAATEVAANAAAIADKLALSTAAAAKVAAAKAAANTTTL